MVRSGLLVFAMVVGIVINVGCGNSKDEAPAQDQATEAEPEPEADLRPGDSPPIAETAQDPAPDQASPAAGERNPPEASADEADRKRRARYQEQIEKKVQHYREKGRKPPLPKSE